jgi:hypothetical protein
MRQVFSWSALIKTRFVCHDLWECGPFEEPLARKSADVIKNCSLFAFGVNPAVSDVVLQEWWNFTSSDYSPKRWVWHSENMLKLVEEFSHCAHLHKFFLFFLSVTLSVMPFFFLPFFSLSFYFLLSLLLPSFLPSWHVEELSYLSAMVSCRFEPADFCIISRYMARSATLTDIQLSIKHVFRDLSYITNDNKLLVAQLVKKFCSVHGTRRLWSWSQGATTRPYPVCVFICYAVVGTVATLRAWRSTGSFSPKHPDPVWVPPSLCALRIWEVTFYLHLIKVKGKVCPRAGHKGPEG